LAAGALTLAGGALLVLLTMGDAVATLVLTGGESAPWRPTRVWYQGTWRLTRRLAVTVLPPRPGELVLQAYAALSLLGLLLLWLVSLAVGWALIYHGLGARLEGGTDWGDLLYASGISLLAPGQLGGAGLAVRLLGLLETVSGLGTIALLISYLPAMYGAYSRREARLLTLDDPEGGRITPVRVIAVHAPDGDLAAFHDFCGEWEMWTAEVLESHVSYPMLALFRSQHAGQSWISALGVVTDAATLACACIVGSEARAPYFLHRRGRRAVVEISRRLHVADPGGEETWLDRSAFDAGWVGLATLQLPLRDKEEAWQRLQALRITYGVRLQQLIDFLVAPHGFWGHSAEAVVAAEVAQATREARLRARRTASAHRDPGSGA
jgi:hypothetical protein